MEDEEEVKGEAGQQAATLVDELAEEEKKESDRLFSSLLQSPSEVVNAGLGRLEQISDGAREQSCIMLGVVPNIERKSKDTFMANQVFTKGEQT